MKVKVTHDSPTGLPPADVSPRLKISHAVRNEDGSLTPTDSIGILLPGRELSDLHVGGLSIDVHTQPYKVLGRICLVIEIAEDE